MKHISVKIIPYTKKGYDDLKKKLEVETLKRPEAVKTLSRAREMGDLSENGLYKAAKFELSNLDRNIRNLKYLIKHGKVLTPTGNDLVQIGHSVIVETESGKKEFLIVGEEEADPKQNKISNKSPIGYNLMGRSVGDEVFINTPGGKIKFIIIAIK